MKSTKWKKFARVAEAIERVRNDGAMVKWNSRLAGARFDVVIWSTYERHEFLIVVNCLDVDVPITPAYSETAPPTLTFNNVTVGSTGLQLSINLAGMPSVEAN